MRTTAERRIQANQYAILAALFPSLFPDCEELRLVIDNGTPAENPDLRSLEIDPTQVSVRTVARRRRAVTESGDRGGALTPW
jgi:hypothetical protein